MARFDTMSEFVIPSMYWAVWTGEFDNVKSYYEEFQSNLNIDDLKEGLRFAKRSNFELCMRKEENEDPRCYIGEWDQIIPYLESIVNAPVQTPDPC